MSSNIYSYEEVYEYWKENDFASIYVEDSHLKFPLLILDELKRQNIQDLFVYRPHHCVTVLYIIKNNKKIAELEVLFYEKFMIYAVSGSYINTDLKEIFVSISQSKVDDAVAEIKHIIPLCSA